MLRSLLLPVAALLASVPALAQTVDPEVTAFCTKKVECDTTQATTQSGCETSVQGDLTNARSVTGDQKCQDVASQIVALISCRSGLTCEQFNLASDPTCLSQSDAVNASLDGGGSPCLEGRPSITVPSEWYCDPSYYGSDDGCDCGCGAVDADCADAGCAEAGCASDSCEYCYDATGADADCPGSAGEGEGEGEAPVNGSGEGEGEGEGENTDDTTSSSSLCSSVGGSNYTFAGLGVALAAVAARRRRR